MKLSLIGVTRDINNNDTTNDIRRELEIFAGKNAGICYMNTPYNSEAISGTESALKRFRFTMNSGHHSVADHCKVTVLFEDAPKMFAIILNSFQDYATSEKSARYTIMENLGEHEKYYYDKWRKKIKDILSSSMSEKQAEKLANENARYFIDIFTPSTTFSYTTSIRQWNYIYEWVKDFIFVEASGYEPDYLVEFMVKLRPCLIDFINAFENTPIYNRAIRDTKARRIDLLPQIYPDIPEPLYERQTYGDSYCIKYYATFSALAQLQRHRSIKYVINDLSSISKPLVFTPHFITGEELSDEWINDMRYCIKHFGMHPQGMIVQVAELGTIDKFLLKCDERLCGRVQYETMTIVNNSLRNFYHSNECSSYFMKELSKWVVLDSDGNIERIRAKCEILEGGCSEKNGCIHGPKKATNRLL